MADKKLLEEIIKSSLIQDWPNCRLKNELITLTDRVKNEPVPYREIDTKQFESLWNKFAPQFNGSQSAPDKSRFKRFITGQILKYCPAGTSKILNQIDRKLKS
jgi:hypothetical protein